MNGRPQNVLTTKYAKHAKRSKRLAHEPFVLDLWVVPEVYQQAQIALLLEHDRTGCHFRAFRVFRSSFPLRLGASARKFAVGFRVVRR